jgi:hypothetical protein
MSSCCAPKRIIAIETTVLRVEGETCNRCGDTVEAVRTAVAELTKALASLQVEVTLTEHAATKENLTDSNSVVINGRPIEEWIGAERVSTECASCGDLVGESVCCAAVSVDGAVQESYTAQQVRDAAFAALGATMNTSGCGCS